MAQPTKVMSNLMSLAYKRAVEPFETRGDVQHAPNGKWVAIPKPDGAAVYDPVLTFVRSELHIQTITQTLVLTETIGHKYGAETYQGRYLPVRWSHNETEYFEDVDWFSPVSPPNYSQ